MYHSEEDARDATVTQAQAIREIRAHECSVSEFLQDVGNKASYSGAEVLDWLGY